MTGLLPSAPPLLLCQLLLLSVASAQLQNADFSGKVNVKVSEILTSRPSGADRSWPPENSNEFAKVDINILGRSIDGATFHNLRPDSTRTNARKLRKILGGYFDRQWMSVEAPRSLNDPKDLPTPGPDTELVRQVDLLNYTFFDAAGAHFEVQRQLLSVFKSWLVRKASCPINYFWEDLGPLFWPRWVRRGHCVPTHTCSWPSGMRCRPSRSRSVRLLQWKCDEDNENLKRKREAIDRRERRKRRKFRRRRLRGGTRSANGWETRQKKRQRRIRRLIRKMSMSVNGYYCYWVIQQYVVNDRCSCMCHEG